MIIKNIASIETTAKINRQYLYSLGSQNQWAVNHRNHEQVVVNTYSFEEFTPYFISSDCDRIMFAEFTARQQYALPNTPRVILIPNAVRSRGEHLLLAQRAQYDLQKLIDYYHEHRSTAELAFDIIKTTEMLTKKYGPFLPTQKMIRASKGPSLILWINQNEALNNVQNPIYSHYQTEPNNQAKYQHEHEQSILGELFRIFSKHEKFAGLTQSLEANSCKTFFQIKRVLSERMKQCSAGHQMKASNCNKPQDRRYTMENKKKIPLFLIENNRSCKNGEKKDKNEQYLSKNNSVANLATLKNRENRQVTDCRESSGNQEKSDIENREQIKRSYAVNPQKKRSEERTNKKYYYSLFRNFEEDNDKSESENKVDKIQENFDISSISYDTNKENCQLSNPFWLQFKKPSKKQETILQDHENSSSTMAHYGNKKTKRSSIQATKRFEYRMQALGKLQKQSQVLEGEQNDMSNQDSNKQFSNYNIIVSKQVLEKNEIILKKPSLRVPPKINIRSPSILQNLVNNGVTSHSISGSSLDRDVSNLFRSGNFSRKPSILLRQAEGIEEELNCLLTQ